MNCSSATRRGSGAGRTAGCLPPPGAPLDTQDLVQDTLTRVFSDCTRSSPATPARSGITSGRRSGTPSATSRARRSGAAPSAPLDTELAGDDPSPLQQAVGQETLDRYEAAMERLRPEEREAIVARIELGLSHAEVAQALGKPSAAAAHMAVSRALVRLAEEMAHDRQRSH